MRVLVCACSQHLQATPGQSAAAAAKAQQEADDAQLAFMLSASERLEVLFGSLGLFVALIAGAGMEDVQTNLVLVALCVYGAYLLFFDGGVTQRTAEEVRTRGKRSDGAC